MPAIQLFPITTQTIISRCQRSWNSSSSLHLVVRALEQPTTPVSRLWPSSKTMETSHHNGQTWSLQDGLKQCSIKATPRMRREVAQLLKESTANRWTRLISKLTTFWTTLITWAVSHLWLALHKDLLSEAQADPTIALNHKPSSIVCNRARSRNKTRWLPRSMGRAQNSCRTTRWVTSTKSLRSTTWKKSSDKRPPSRKTGANFKKKKLMFKLNH